MMKPVFGLVVICAGCDDRFETLYGEFEEAAGLSKDMHLFNETQRVGWRYVLEDDGSRRGWFCGPCFNALGQGGGPKKGA